MQESNSSKEFVKAVLVLRPLDRIRPTSPPCLQGSVIIQKLLNFKPEISCEVIKGLSTSDIEDLKIWASHPAASHVFEKAIDSKTTERYLKIQLISTFKGEYCFLAKDKFGSHIIDKFWKTVELRQKVFTL